MRPLCPTTAYVHEQALGEACRVPLVYSVVTVGKAWTSAGYRRTLPGEKKQSVEHARGTRAPPLLCLAHSAFSFFVFFSTRLLFGPLSR